MEQNYGVNIPLSDDWQTIDHFYLSLRNFVTGPLRPWYCYHLYTERVDITLWTDPQSDVISIIIDGQEIFKTSDLDLYYIHLDFDKKIFHLVKDIGLERRRGNPTDKRTGRTTELVEVYRASFDHYEFIHDNL